jgi:hypothetical protein
VQKPFEAGMPPFTKEQIKKLMDYFGCDDYDLLEPFLSRGYSRE